MKLSPLQTKIINKIAKADCRTNTQVLSLILAEGVRFYFCEYDPRFGCINEDELVEQLEQEAALEAGHFNFKES